MTHFRSLSDQLMEMYRRMQGRFGPQDWWPAQSELEVVVGAILTQNTNWKNVETAISNLKDRNLLGVKRLQSVPIEALAQAIRPAGYFNVKARRLKNLIALVVDHYRGSLSLLLREDTQRMRDALLSVSGVGPETADSILLYAAHRPVFVVDAYTRRILARHGLGRSPSGYDDIQQMFQDHLEKEERLFNEFHALIVQTGKVFCRSRPRCGECPLNHWPDETYPALPESGG
jgi:endonuclease-3 related protein